MQLWDSSAAHEGTTVSFMSPWVAQLDGHHNCYKEHLRGSWAQTQLSRSIWEVHWPEQIWTQKSLASSFGAHFHLGYQCWAFSTAHGQSACCSPASRLPLLLGQPHRCSQSTRASSTGASAPATWFPWLGKSSLRKAFFVSSTNHRTLNPTNWQDLHGTPTDESAEKQHFSLRQVQQQQLLLAPSWGCWQHRAPGTATQCIPRRDAIRIQLLFSWQKNVSHVSPIMIATNNHAVQW